MRAERDEDAADEAGEQGVRLARIERKVEDAELARRRRAVEDAAEATGCARDQDPERGERARDVDDELRGVGPEHGSQAAVPGVENGRDACHRHGDRERPPRHLLHHDRGEVEPQPVGQRPGRDEQHRSRLLHHAAEAGVEHLVGGDEGAAEE